MRCVPFEPGHQNYLALCLSQNCMIKYFYSAPHLHIYERYCFGPFFHLYLIGLSRSAIYFSLLTPSNIAFTALIHNFVKFLATIIYVKANK